MKKISISRNASGFQSKIEKDVLHYLLQGTQPIIIDFARGLKKRNDPYQKRKPQKKGAL